jgi:hypothetical protein
MSKNVRAYSFLTPMLNACMEDINFHSLPEIHKPQQKTKTTYQHLRATATN